ncbi:MAG TPA: tRNA pseudouridine(55) synthase TruB [Patescibacteria group bacterium]|nr:tRNA pseudouridine(55) synthase TruB [Patescibacteria group bacterium]
MQGFLLVDKPRGISSFKVVAEVRGIIKRETGVRLKVGHSGTLDPQATGLLIIAIGAYTKRLPEFIKKDKTYTVSMRFGFTSTTGDVEGEITKLSDNPVSKASLMSVLRHFTGDIMQVPPVYSAIKVAGQRAYKLARKGQNIKLEPRPITINGIELLNYSYPDVDFRTNVSSGTYIRSLVEDIGKKLEVGAYMSGLRRESIGQFNIDSAVALKELTYAKIKDRLITLEN